MSILKKSSKKFYTLFVDEEGCKICFRNLSPKRVVLEEERKEVEFKDDNCIDEINKFIKEDSYVSLLQSSPDQGISKKGSVDEGTNLVNGIDGDLVSFLDLGVAKGLEDSFSFKIDEFMSPFKVLYYIYKNSNLITTSMFILKFHNSLAIMVANKESVLSAQMIDISDFYDDGSGELFFETIKVCIEAFYKESNEFIDKIYIYSTEELGAEMGYYIFTKIFIRTEIPTFDLLDFVSKINIKENF